MIARALLLLLLVGLLAPGAAHADPITATAFLATYIGGTAAAFIVSYAGTIAMVSLAAYTTISARSKAAKARAKARADHNAGLQDRNVTVLSADPPRRAVYGRCEVGGAVVAMFTTDKVRPGGGTKPDAYKHLVIVWAAHQCHAIHDIKIDGVSIGALSGDGSATGGPWAQPDAEQITTVTAAGNATSLSLNWVTRVISVCKVDTGEGGGSYVPPEGGPDGWSLTGWTLNLPTTSAPGGWEVTFVQGVAAQAGLGNPVSADTTVSVRHHLGAPDQAADARLMDLLPGQWTADHRLRGLCYSVITLDLERSQFQGGPPGITADISGKLVLDRRSGQTAWSDNPVLCTDDWLRSDLGYSVALADVDAASAIASANACDVSTSFTTGATTTTAKRYTCNGVVSAEMAKEAVLQDLCESMGGWASYGGNWRLMAGAWVPPVMSLSDDDLAGPISIVQAGEPSGELFNAVRCQYVPAGSSVPAEGEPYKNPTFITADGRTLWRDLDLPFTSDKARAKNLCRIQTEQVRNGLVIHYPAKLKAWPLQTGDRVTVTSAEYGFAAKTFRVIDWQFGLAAPVGLTLQEDDAAAYDEADATLSDPTPNTQLPDPWTVPALSSLTLSSGTAELQRLGDGTILSRVRVSWPRSQAAYMDSGRIELSWRTAGSSVWTVVNAAGDDTQAYLTGVKDRTQIIVSAVVVNGNGARSPAVSEAHFVLGKSAAPAAVAGLAAAVIPGAVRITWTPCAEADYAETLLRVGPSWAAGTPLPSIGPASSYDWLWPAVANHTIWAAHLDTSGNRSNPVSVAVNVTAAALNLGAGVINPDAGWLNSNLLPAINQAAGENLWTGSLATVRGNHLGASVSNAAFDDPRGTKTAVVVTLPVAQSYVYWEPIAKGFAVAGWYTVTLKLKVASPMSIVVATTDAKSWVSSQYAIADSYQPNPGAWVSVTLRQYVPADGGLHVAVGSSHNGTVISSSPASTAVAICDLFVRREGFAGDMNATFGATLGDNIKNQAGQTVSILGGANLFRNADFAQMAGARPEGVDLYTWGADAIRSVSPINGAVNSGRYFSLQATSTSDARFGFYITSASIIGGWPSGPSQTAYVISFYAIATGRLAGQRFNGGWNSPAPTSFDWLENPPANGGWQRYSVRLRRPATTDSMYFPLDGGVNINDLLFISNIKVEVGDIASGWDMPGISSLNPLTDGNKGSNGYTGALDATKNLRYYQDSDPGAVAEGSLWISSTRAWERIGGAWRPYVGPGSVGTGELGAQAATDVAVFFDAAGVGYSNMS